jgi:4-hydroxythreonine-4-phosphate dehydrogenase
MGDPAGIGVELAIEAFCRRHDHASPTFVFIGDPDLVRARAGLLGHTLAVITIDAAALAAPAGDALPVLPVPCAAPSTPGQPDSRNGAAVVRCIDWSVELIRSGAAGAVMTMPIAKDVLAKVGFPHPGHTEYLGELAQRHWGVAAAPVMMLACDELKVVPVTVHMALASVPGRLTQDLIVEVAHTTLSALQGDFGIARPRLAVCGLNPHAGERGLMGNEEQTTIAPAVRRLQALGLDVTGPYPADTLFHAEARTRYDAVLAMYHDQGLIPLKTLAFDRGVNVTLGLPFVRTSPDHGTAFDIAGKGVASVGSVVAALRMAQDMAQRRSAQPA